ncbi:MAG: phosphoglycerate kinase [archaeon]
MEKYDFISNIDVKGKTILLRVDFNTSIINGNPVLSARIEAHSASIDFFLKKGAKVVVLAHQGDKGKPDFCSLLKHAEMASKIIGTKIPLVSWNDNFLERIRALKNGEALLMENTRFLDFETLSLSPEEHSHEPVIKQLASAADFFVLDAFSVCHRSHASIVGFKPLLPCFGGPALEDELSALEKLGGAKTGRVVLLGGAKPEDSIKLLKEMLEKGEVDRVLLGGLMGQLFLKSRGTSFGEYETFFEKRGFLQFLPEIKKILSIHSDKMVLPIDVAVDRMGARAELRIDSLPGSLQIGDSVKDIGSETVELFSKELSGANFVLVNGPVGVFEEKEFTFGTHSILSQLALSSVYSILGGGDTENAVRTLGFKSENFSHVSLGGKALLNYLSGKTLSGLEILKK